MGYFPMKSWTSKFLLLQVSKIYTFSIAWRSCTINSANNVLLYSTIECQILFCFKNAKLLKQSVGSLYLGFCQKNNINTSNEWTTCNIKYMLRKWSDTEKCNWTKFQVLNFMNCTLKCKCRTRLSSMNSWLWIQRYWKISFNSNNWN